MLWMKVRHTIWMVLVLVFSVHPVNSIASTPSAGIPAGMTLADALNQLRSSEFTILFSDRLISDELKVKRNVQIDNPLDTALGLLAEHGLTLRNLRPGLFVVTRSTATEQSERVALTDAEPLAEVAIYASRYSSESTLTSMAQLERTDIESLAGLNEDVLRVTRTLPGTASTPLSAKSYIRGGGDDEMLVRFDGIPQLAPFHFKDYGAILGSIDPTVIESLDFYSGVFPARHGDRLSAVMDIHPRDGASGTHHELGVSLLATHGISSGETEVDRVPTRWLVAGRSSNLGVVAKVADIEDVDVEFASLLLRGEQVRGDWTIVAGMMLLQDELEYSRDASDDDEDSFGSDLRASEKTDSGYQDRTLWMRLKKSSDDGRQLAVSLARYDLHANREGKFSNNPIVTGEAEEQRDIQGLYLEGSWRQAGSWSVGAELLDIRSQYDHSIQAIFNPTLATLFRRSSALDRRSVIDTQTRAASIYASKLVTLSPRWRADVGLRADHRNQPRNAIDWSPRLAMEYELSDGRFLRASAGRTSQGQRADELQVADGETIFHPVQKADQWVLGYEQLLADHGAWRIEAYRKQIQNPSPRYENVLNPVSLIPEMEIDRRRIAPDGALAYGIEFAGRYTVDEHWSGFLNYAWSEVEDDFGATDVPRNWNQQHALLLGLQWRSGPWSLSGQGSWRTGWSRTEFQVGDSGDLLPVVGERNRSRWPAQWNLDLRASWRKPLKVGLLEVALDVNNATNRSNPCCTDLRLTATGLETRTRSWLPRYLNIGVVWSLP